MRRINQSALPSEQPHVGNGPRRRVGERRRLRELDELRWRRPERNRGHGALPFAMGDLGPAGAVRRHLNFVAAWITRVRRRWRGWHATDRPGPAAGTTASADRGRV